MPVAAGPSAKPPKPRSPRCGSPESSNCKGRYTYNTPILIPLTRAQAIKLTNVAGGVGFDHNGDGLLERTAWTAADSKSPTW